VRWVSLAILLAGCGQDSVPTFTTDASPDTGDDAAVDTPPPPPGCDYGELADLTNDFTVSNNASEATGLVLDAPVTICGNVDSGHFDSGAGVVDLDGYVVHVSARTAFRVELSGDAAALAGLEVRVIDSGLEVVDAGAYRGTHVAFGSTLIAGDYQLAVIASDAADIATPIPYKLRVIPDPAPCAAVTTAATYTEANDGPQANRNDVVEVRFAPAQRALTAATNDSPEPTGIVTVAGTDVRISGTSADVDAADDFRDRDTYLIETGADTDELAVRVDWTGAADLDVLVFPENTTAEIASATSIQPAGPEATFFPVLPSTRYWVWVGSYDGSTGLPVDYDITMCPSTYTP